MKPAKMNNNGNNSSNTPKKILELTDALKSTISDKYMLEEIKRFQDHLIHHQRTRCNNPNFAEKRTVGMNQGLLHGMYEFKKDELTPYLDNKREKTFLSSLVKMINTRTSELVMVKFPQYSTNSNIIGSFAKELSVLKTLKDKNFQGIPSFLGYTREREWGPVGIVMQCIHGGDLNKFTHGNGMPHNEWLEVGAKLCGILINLHNIGIAHKDIKPGNILLDKDNNVFICDFGCASRIRNSKSASIFDAITTPRDLETSIYRSMRSDETSIQIDVFALCKTLYEVRAGKFYNQEEMLRELSVAHNATELDKLICNGMSMNLSKRPTLFELQKAFNDEIQQQQVVNTIQPGTEVTSVPTVPARLSSLEYCMILNVTMDFIEDQLKLTNLYVWSYSQRCENLQKFISNLQDKVIAVAEHFKRNNAISDSEYETLKHRAEELIDIARKRLNTFTSVCPSKNELIAELETLNANVSLLGCNDEESVIKLLARSETLPDNDITPHMLCNQRLAEITDKAWLYLRGQEQVDVLIKATRLRGRLYDLGCKRYTANPVLYSPQPDPHVQESPDQHTHAAPKKRCNPS